MTEEHRLDTAMLLEKLMYGNFDTAIKFFKSFATHVTDPNGMNMIQTSRSALSPRKNNTLS